MWTVRGLMIRIAHSRILHRMKWTRVRTSILPFIRYSLIRWSIVFIFHATPIVFIFHAIRGWFVLIRFLVCRRPIKKQRFRFIYHSVWLTFCRLYWIGVDFISIMMRSHTHSHLRIDQPAVFLPYHCSKWTVNIYTYIHIFRAIRRFLSNAKFYYIFPILFCCNAGWEFL